MSTPAIYRDRRARLSKAIGSGLVLFLGNDEVGMNYTANVYPFRQDSSFLYFWALDQPGLAAVIDIDARTETLFGDDVTIADVVWSGPQPTIASRAAEAGVKKTAASGKLADVVQAALKKKRPVHFLAPYRAEHVVEARRTHRHQAGEGARQAVDRVPQGRRGPASLQDTGGSRGHRDGGGRLAGDVRRGDARREARPQGARDRRRDREGRDGARLHATRFRRSARCTARRCTTRSTGTRSARAT